MRSGGVRFWGTAAQIEPACSLGKQNCCNSVNVLLFGAICKPYFNISEMICHQPHAKQAPGWHGVRTAGGQNASTYRRIVTAHASIQTMDRSVA